MVRYTIYKTTNNITKKYYIGVHKTKNPLDDYLGSGLYLKFALDKYGIENFSKEILFEFNLEDEAFQKESEIVTWELIESGEVYNLVPGGKGGWDRVLKILGISREEWNRQISPFCEGFYDSLTKEQKEKMLLGAKKGAATQVKNKTGYMDPVKAKKGRDNARSVESREKRKKTFQEIKHSQGEKNSQFGTCWIMNVELKQNKKILKEEVNDWLLEGWILGRRCHKDF